MDWPSPEDFAKIVDGGILLVVIVLLIWPRKSNGDRRSSLLVSGWTHDNALEETERVRSHYQAQLLAQQIECEKRINEYRELYAGEHKMRQALDERFKEVNAREEAQTKLMNELRVEIMESRRRAEKRATARP